MKRRKVLELSEVTALKSAEQVFGQEGENRKKALEQLEQFEKSERLGGAEGEDIALNMVEDEDEYGEEYGEEYEDDEEGDYNAEGAFENGEDDEYDYADEEEPTY